MLQNYFKLTGVVAEVSSPLGFATVAVFANHPVRYYNFPRKVIKLSKDDTSLNPLIQIILNQGRKILPACRRSNSSVSPSPGKGKARIKVFTSEGLFTIESYQSQLFQDRVTREIMHALVDLTASLICKKKYAGFTEPLNN